MFSLGVFFAETKFMLILISLIHLKLPVCAHPNLLIANQLVLVGQLSIADGGVWFKFIVLIYV